jgi:excisionase family DNA binding protein
MPDIDHGPVSIEDLKGRSFATVEEVAKILQLDRRTVRSACQDGEIPHVKTAGVYRIPVSWILQKAAGVTA